MKGKDAKRMKTVRDKEDSASRQSRSDKHTPCMLCCILCMLSIFILHIIVLCIKLRIEHQRIAQNNLRAREDSVECTARIDDQRIRQANKRAREDSVERTARIEDQRIRQANTRAREDSVERTARIEDQRIRQANKRAREHSTERDARLNTDRCHHRELYWLRVQEALKAKTRLGCVDDTANFQEREFDETVITHNLQNLITASNNCPKCHAYRWKEERPGFCCEKGRIKLNDLPEPPAEIQQLYESGNSFLNSLRSFNNALAMASIGCEEMVIPGFNPTFKIQGKVYHRIGALLPNQCEEPKFAQIYFHDTDHEVSNRLQHNQHLPTNALQTLQQCIHRVNPYVLSIKAALEYATSHPEVQMLLTANRKPSNEHRRRYNLPTTSEVAVILPGEQTSNLDVVLQTRGGHLQRINELHRSYDPLHYVILFPYGTDGYTVDVPHASGQGRVTTVEFYRFRLQVRDVNRTFNQLMRSRRLLQQYVCDQFAKAEGQRLHWARSHQKEIRADKYQGLLDAVNDNDELRAGSKVILPPTVYGSPRWYAESFQDAMAIVRAYGKPDLFITFTCNPSWPEIKNSLFVGEQPSDRPDLCVRVFHLKLNALLDDLIKNNILGKVNAFTAMKEDQKRGLPHCHILIILNDDDKPRQPADIDRIVSAEIPDKEVNERLWGIITKQNIHGPCGGFNPASPCMVGNATTRSCEKNFPKSFRKHTVVTDSTYPEYRRRSTADGGQQFSKTVGEKTITIDNRWIVPYNPFLSVKYDAHINVEVVYSIKAVKYLYKYITKGSDRVIIRMANGGERDITNDEIERFVNARYISASEAYWRIYEFKIQYKYPPVSKLPLHLENEQTVIFQSTDARDVALRGPPPTKLTAYFQLNRDDPDASNILYPDIYKYYRWNKGKWVKRLANVRRHRETSVDDTPCSDMIGRIPIINLNGRQSELYFMRMLLYHKAGAKSFKDLRIVDGEEQPTYQEACIKMGLFADDSEVDRVMEEAASVRFGTQLRGVFATILMFITPSNPAAFWERHKLFLCEDIMRRNGTKVQPTEDEVNEALLDIQEQLERCNFSLADFQLPTPNSILMNRGCKEMREESDYILKP